MNLLFCLRCLLLVGFASCWPGSPAFAQDHALPANQSPAPAKGPELREMTGVWQADWNFDGSRILVWADDGLFGLWNTADGLPLRSELSAATPDGRCLVDSAARQVLVGLKKGGSQVFDLTNGRAVSPVLDVSCKNQGEPAAFFSPDGEQVIIFTDTGAGRVFAVKSGESLASLPLTAINQQLEATPQAAWTTDGQSAFVLDSTGILHRYDARSWQAAGAPMPHPDRQAYHYGFSISEDGSHAVTFDHPGENGPQSQLQLWDAVACKPLGKPIFAQNGIYGTFIDGGKRLVLTPSRGETRVLKIPSLEVDFVFPRHDDVESTTIRLTTDKKHFLSWGYDRCIRRLDVATGKNQGNSFNAARMMHVIVGPDPGSIWVSYDNSAMFLQRHPDWYMVRHSLTNMRPAAEVRLPDYLHSATLSPNGSCLMMIRGRDDHHRIHLYDPLKLTELPVTKER